MFVKRFLDDLIFKTYTIILKNTHTNIVCVCLIFFLKIINKFLPTNLLKKKLF